MKLKPYPKFKAKYGPKWRLGPYQIAWARGYWANGNGYSPEDNPYHVNMHRWGYAFEITWADGFKASQQDRSMGDNQGWFVERLAQDNSIKPYWLTVKNGFAVTEN